MKILEIPIEEKLIVNTRVVIPETSNKTFEIRKAVTRELVSITGLWVMVDGSVYIDVGNNAHILKTFFLVDYDIVISELFGIFTYNPTREKYEYKTESFPIYRLEFKDKREMMSFIEKNISFEKTIPSLFNLGKLNKQFLNQKKK